MEESALNGNFSLAHVAGGSGVGWRVGAIVDPVHYMALVAMGGLHWDKTWRVDDVCPSIKRLAVLNNCDGLLNLVDTLIIVVLATEGT